MCSHQGVWWSSRRAPSPTWIQASLTRCLGACRIDEERRLVQIACAATPAGNVAEDAQHLLGGEAHGRSDRLGGYAVVERIHAYVQRAQRDAEEELFLRLFERVGVGRRRAGADLFRRAEVRGELVDLRLIQMGD